MTKPFELSITFSLGDHLSAKLHICISHLDRCVWTDVLWKVFCMKVID